MRCGISEGRFCMMFSTAPQLLYAFTLYEVSLNVVVFRTVVTYGCEPVVRVLVDSFRVVDPEKMPEAPYVGSMSMGEPAAVSAYALASACHPV